MYYEVTFNGDKMNYISMLIKVENIRFDVTEGGDQMAKEKKASSKEENKKELSKTTQKRLILFLKEKLLVKLRHAII